MRKQGMNLDNVGNVVGQLVLKVDLHLVLLDLVVEVLQLQIVQLQLTAHPTPPANKQPYQANVNSCTKKYTTGLRNKKIII
jgi:hypothetical protein